MKSQNRGQRRVNFLQVNINEMLVLGTLETGF